jgi:GT2 family glycosyltransferase
VSDLEVSVVIAAWNSRALLERCLASLEDQCRAGDPEIIVVSNYDNGSREMIEKRFPQVRFLRLPEGTTVPRLRAEGIRQARGEVVALIEDQCFVDRDWCAEIKKAHRLPYLAVGGSVENASTERAIDWAVYFYDYGRYMLPGVAGAAAELPGNNVSYKRAALQSIERAFRNGFFETFINWELKASGGELFFAPSAIVYHNRSYETGEAFSECYHHGRAFAGKRVSGVGLAVRVARAIATLALPVVLSSRIVRATVGKRRHIKELLLALPHITLLMVTWSFGELTGYLLGEGGSASRWA